MIAGILAALQKSGKSVFHWERRGQGDGNQDVPESSNVIPVASLH